MILKSKHHKGFGLVIALLIVAVVTGLLTSLYKSQSGEVLRKEAEIAGWEGAKIARAARIYARNQISSGTPLTVAALDPNNGGAPIEIDIGDLIAESLLPSGFARENSGNYFNALGQRIRIFLANYPVNDDTSLTTSTAAPTAYVLFEDTAQTNARLMQDVVAAIRSQDVSVSAPVFNGVVNITGSCNGGGNTVALWDSGCLDTTDYDLLIDGIADGADVFQPGSFIIPTWRSASFDTRAMMRFPQPEQTDVQTMLTDLEMANLEDCSLGTNFVTVPSGSGVTSDTTLCRALSDDTTVGAEIDNRRSIIGVNNIENSLDLIVDPQSGGDVNRDSNGFVTVTADEFNALNVNGQYIGTGDVFVYGNNTTIGDILLVDKNIRVTSDNTGAFVGASAEVGLLTANNLSSTNLTANNTVTSNGNIAISGITQNINMLNVNGNFSPQRLTASSAGTEIRVFEQATITTADATNVNIGGADAGVPGLSSSFIAGKISVPDLNVTQRLAVGDRVNLFGDTTVDRIDVTNGGSAQCLGDCPRRRYTVECTNIQNAGGFPFDGYNNFEQCVNR